MIQVVFSGGNLGSWGRLGSLLGHEFQSSLLLSLFCGPFSWVWIGQKKLSGTQGLIGLEVGDWCSSDISIVGEG